MRNRVVAVLPIPISCENGVVRAGLWMMACTGARGTQTDDFNLGQRHQIRNSNSIIIISVLQLQSRRSLSWPATFLLCYQPFETPRVHKLMLTNYHDVMISNPYFAAQWSAVWP
jgi:hypothetical protein